MSTRAEARCCLRRRPSSQGFDSRHILLVFCSLFDSLAYSFQHSNRLQLLTYQATAPLQRTRAGHALLTAPLPDSRSLPLSLLGAFIFSKDDLTMVSSSLSSTVLQHQLTLAPSLPSHLGNAPPTHQGVSFSSLFSKLSGLFSRQTEVRILMLGLDSA